mmetsp:Transcript_36432/g.97357  ORF Transcript_36432/g.97357 Transcript_36432/m.97357 type:complete len:213 (-) Transcript_36432:57-695(-)
MGYLRCTNGSEFGRERPGRLQATLRARRLRRPVCWRGPQGVVRLPRARGTAAVEPHGAYPEPDGPEPARAHPVDSAARVLRAYGLGARLQQAADRAQPEGHLRDHPHEELRVLAANHWPDVRGGAASPASPRYELCLVLLEHWSLAIHPSTRLPSTGTDPVNTDPLNTDHRYQDRHATRGNLVTWRLLQPPAPYRTPRAPLLVFGWRAGAWQ